MHTYLSPCPLVSTMGIQDRHLSAYKLCEQQGKVLQGELDELDERWEEQEARVQLLQSEVDDLEFALATAGGARRPGRRGPDPGHASVAPEAGLERRVLLAALTAPGWSAGGGTTSIGGSSSSRRPQPAFEVT